MILKTSRTGLAAVAVAAVALAALAMTVARPARVDPRPPAGAPPVVSGGSLDALAAAPHLLFRGMPVKGEATYVGLASLADRGAPRAATGLDCERVSFAAGFGLCLQAHRAARYTFDAILFDARFQPLARWKLDGVPSRTRMSPDGKYGAITIFLTGEVHAYQSISFSTRTTIVDVATRHVTADLEQFQATRDGRPFSEKDFNFWGVTFARDSNVFYATLMTGGKTYLVRGDVAGRTVAVLYENVECPALSPDERLIAYKRRVVRNLPLWRFSVLDLSTMTERQIDAESRSIDDQIEWLDDTHVLYGAARSSQSPFSDVWVASISGNEPARTFLLEAESPIVVR